MRQSTKLILNTGATYVRMLVTVGIGLVFTRLAFQGLGQDDFGLWSVIVSTVMWLTVLSDSLVQAVDRFLAFEIGRAEPGQVRRTFASSAVLFGAVGAAIGVLGASLSWWAVGLVNAPAPRLDAATWALVWTCLSTGVTVSTTPFRSLFVAHQEIAFLSLIEIGDSVLRLAVVVIALALPGDHLVRFTQLILSSQVIMAALSIAVCLWRYPESRVGPAQASARDFRKLASFGGWSMLGNFAYRVRLSGPPLILAQHYGVAFNAAYAIANQLAGYQTQMAASLARASRPAIVRAAGAGNASMSRNLTVLSSKYSSWMVGLPVLLVMFEAEVLLRLWLRDVPENAALFVRVVCVTFALPWLSIGHQHAINGTGRIGLYVSFCLACDLCAFAAGWTLAVQKQEPHWLLLAFTIGVLAFSVGTPLFFARSAGVRVSEWLAGVVRPVVVVIALSTAVGLAIQGLVAGGIIRLLASCAGVSTAYLSSCWFLGMMADEREHFQRIASAFKHRLTRARATSGEPPLTPIS